MNSSDDALLLGFFGGCFDGTVEERSPFSAIVYILYLLVFVLFFSYFLYKKFLWKEAETPVPVAQERVFKGSTFGPFSHL